MSYTSAPEKKYISIDLKSFYASVECVERGLDPLKTNLVVADAARTEKTICLAVSPPLKKYGISGRARLFEVVQGVAQINAQRAAKAADTLSGESYNSDELKANPHLKLSYIVAPPRMALYLEYSRKITQIYLKYLAPEDLHQYSVDEIFADVTAYLRTYNMSARTLAAAMIKDVLTETGITATAGVGTNLYLCKIAMDIVAKHAAPDADGVRIAELDEMSYRRLLWSHEPLTDFWRVGRGYAKKLAEHGMYTMGDVARCSVGSENDYYNEDLLYRLFGVNAELLIDHAWGVEPCTMADIKSYKSQAESISSGQVLAAPYTADKAELIVREMADALATDLTAKGYVTNQITLTIGYDTQNLKGDLLKEYAGEIKKDRYGRSIPSHSHGTENLTRNTCSARVIKQAAAALFGRLADQKLLIRRINICANNILPTEDAKKNEYVQFSIFDGACMAKNDAQKDEPENFAGELALRSENPSGLLQNDRGREDKEAKAQEAVLKIRKKYGKNAVVKAMNLEEGATAISRNGQIGGHKA